MGLEVLGFRILDDEKLVSMATLREILAEIIGTFFLIYLGCGGIYGKGDATVTSAAILQIAFAFSLGIGGAVHLFSDISGGQFNPAVSFALFFARKLSLVKAAIFTVAQFVGALIGCGILKGLLGKVPGAVVLQIVDGRTVSGIEGMFLEFFGTLFLVLTVLATTNSKRNHAPGYLQPFSIGISIFVAHMFLVKTTGCGINPARSFATNVFENEIGSDFYAYVIGPLLASVVGGLLYEFFFDPYYQPASHQALELNGEAEEEEMLEKA